MRRKTIQYGIDNETGFIVSRFGDKVAFEVVDFEGMDPENNFRKKYNLEKGDALSVLPHMSVKWTRKIPKDEKNRHREFWGMKKLK